MKMLSNYSLSNTEQNSAHMENAPGTVVSAASKWKTDCWTEYLAAATDSWKILPRNMLYLFSIRQHLWTSKWRGKWRARVWVIERCRATYEQLQESLDHVIPSCVHRDARALTYLLRHTCQTHVGKRIIEMHLPTTVDPDQVIAQP